MGKLNEQLLSIYKTVERVKALRDANRGNTTSPLYLSHLTVLENKLNYKKLRVSRFGINPVWRVIIQNGDKQLRILYSNVDKEDIKLFFRVFYPRYKILNITPLGVGKFKENRKPR